MAEFITEMQERLLPEYEQMTKYHVFTPEQVREVVSRHERFFLNITKRHLSVNDYLEFIVYEKQLHQIINEKEKEMHMKLTGLKSAICQRIMRLFREVLSKFPHDRKLWGLWLKFGKKSIPQEIAGIYEKMLQYHSDDPEIWVEAALWVYEYNRLNMERVQDILLRGLQRHSTSEALNKCFFHILLKEASLADSEKHFDDELTQSEQDIKLERVEAVYRNSLKHITHLDYFIKLLEDCEAHFDLTIKLQRLIISDMQEMFSREPGLWDLLAQRELRGHHLGDLEADGARPTRPFKNCLQHCVMVYKTAVEQQQTPEMWNRYLDAMVALNATGNKSTSERSLRRQCLADALQEGHRSKLMHHRHYAVLRKLLCTTPAGQQTAVQLLKEALKQDSSLEMHELLLLTCIQCNDEPQIFEHFTQIRKSIPDAKALAMWQNVIRYYRTRGDELAKHRLAEIYTQACQSMCVEFGELRADYLNYLWLEDSREVARKEYAKLALQPPMSLQLHRQLAQLEGKVAIRDAANIKSLRMCYEHMTLHFGKTEPSVWIEYLAFERDHGDAKNIQLIAHRAVTTLEAKYVPIFEAELAVAHLEATLVR